MCPPICVASSAQKRKSPQCHCSVSHSRSHSPRLRQNARDAATFADVSSRERAATAITMSAEQQKRNAMQHGNSTFDHPRIARRTAVQAGSISLLGLGVNHLAGLRAASAGVHNERIADSLMHLYFPLRWLVAARQL